MEKRVAQNADWDLLSSDLDSKSKLFQELKCILERMKAAIKEETVESE